jgi:hypothetical protein
MDNFEWQKTNFINCLEEDLEDQSALYNVVYSEFFLDRNQRSILKEYIDKNPLW